jgi:hypothetical protein
MSRTKKPKRSKKPSRAGPRAAAGRQPQQEGSRQTAALPSQASRIIETFQNEVTPNRTTTAKLPPHRPALAAAWSRKSGMACRWIPAATA